MLEFINEVIYKMNKKASSRHYNRHKFHAIENEMVQINKLGLISKLVYSQPLGETLLDNIEDHWDYFIGDYCFEQAKYEQIFQDIASRGRHYNFNALSDKDRWAVAELMRKKAKSAYLKRIDGLSDILQETDREMSQLEDKRVSSMLKKMDIVAMTTTGASKYRSQLRRVGAKVVMVEEAAEVLEAQIVTSVARETEQLILIGDHMQLKPKVNSFTLAEDYGLSMSMFERLIKLGVANVQLKYQRRMRPEISQLVRHIYPDLKDHPSVHEYPDIRYKEAVL